MLPFVYGLIVGLAAAAAVAAILWRAAYKRILRLQENIKHNERLAELGTLTGGLAHELKNPLSTVQLNLQLLAEELHPSDPAHVRLANRLKIAQKEMTRLRDTLDDFLRYGGKIELDRKPLDLGNMLEELADFFTPQANLQRVQIRLDKPPEPVIALADEKLMKQAVLNLMLNALHAMNGGGELILSARRQEKMAQICVTDTGAGIPAASLDRIFDAYYSTRQGGTGLGLAMTRRIVHEHSGQISVRSEEGKGSEFTLSLPAVDG